MARYIYQGVFQDGNGAIIAEGTVSVFEAASSTKADVYAAYAGGAAVNSVESGTDGHFLFYVDSGDYSTGQEFKITLSKTDYTSKSWDYVVIF